MSIDNENTFNEIERKFAQLEGKDAVSKPVFLPQCNPDNAALIEVYTRHAEEGSKKLDEINRRLDEFADKIDKKSDDLPDPKLIRASVILDNLPSDPAERVNALHEFGAEYAGVLDRELTDKFNAAVLSALEKKADCTQLASLSDELEIPSKKRLLIKKWAELYARFPSAPEKTLMEMRTVKNELQGYLYETVNDEAASLLLTGGDYSALRDFCSMTIGELVAPFTLSPSESKRVNLAEAVGDIVGEVAALRLELERQKKHNESYIPDEDYSDEIIEGLSDLKSEIRNLLKLSGEDYDAKD